LRGTNIEWRDFPWRRKKSSRKSTRKKIFAVVIGIRTEKGETITPKERKKRVGNADGWLKFQKAKRKKGRKKEKKSHGGKKTLTLVPRKKKRKKHRKLKRSAGGVPP